MESGEDQWRDLVEITPNGKVGLELGLFWRLRLRLRLRPPSRGTQEHFLSVVWFLCLVLASVMLVEELSFHGA